MKDIDMAMLVDGVAKVISGAPFPSKQSLSKARKAVEFVLAAPALDIPSLAKIEKLRAENQEFREDVDRWTGEVGRLTAERDQLHADKQHYLAEALRWSTEAVRLQALLHDAQFNDLGLVDGKLRALLCNVVDNLSDTPVSDEWARRTVESLNSWINSSPSIRQPVSPQGVDVASRYPIPRNRTEAAALARLILAYLGVIDAHIDQAIARMETDTWRVQP